jgi:lipid-A-disaccharide synthase
MYGAQLIEALRRRSPSIDFFGVGGPAMREAGCRIVVDSQDLAVVGISEILSHLPKIFGRFRKLIAESEKTKPDIAVVIDSPAFNWRVARQMHKRGIPVVYYVCPQFWAWRQGRVRLLRKYVSKALVIFPFEERFYCDRGVDAEFVGHPLADLAEPHQSRAEYAAMYRLDPVKPWITLMPGSRLKEVAMNLPVILESAAKLGSGYEFLLPVAPTLERSFLESLIRALPIHLVAEALPALALSRGGIIASGTATVEAAMMDTPFVMVYRVTPLTYYLGRRTVKVPYFAMVNLIAGRKVVPELIQKDFTAEKVVGHLLAILPDGPARNQMLAGLAEVRDRLRGPGQAKVHPATRAAEAILACSRGRLAPAP